MASVSKQVEIGLVNNMPLAAREATTRQFRDLLESASGATSIRLRLFLLTGPDGGTDQAPAYSPIEQIYETGIDALIFTGAEPTARDLRDEPYWSRLAELLDWTEENGVPAVLSCLAAHAAALHLDGIARRPLSEKCFGVFEETICADHPLTRGLPARPRIPHSRWNELAVDDLIDAGYQLLTSSPTAGADVFVRNGRGMFLYFQGHPEYEADRLLLEYRRDARRFISGVRPNYPNLPHGYFDPSTENILREFQEKVMCSDRGDTMVDFPIAIAAPPTASWRPEAEGIVRNWLGYVREHAA